MGQAFDIAIRRARLRGRGDRLAEIGIHDGRIVAIAERFDGKAAMEIDARGNLVTESFVNPHLHLCKVWTLPMMEEEALKTYQGESMGKAMAGIELASKIKEKYAELWIVENARRAVALAALHGNLHIRAFADVDSKARLEGLKALIRVRDEFRGIVDIQVVAFAQDGIVREPGAAELMHQAMKLALMSSAAFLGSSSPTPMPPRTSAPASTLLRNSTRTSRCSLTTPAIRVCAHWK